MLIANINLDINHLIKLFNYKIDDIYLINIYDDGICITQNINNISNLSIYISNNIFNEFELSKEISFVTDNLLNLSNVNIKFVNNKYYRNNKEIKINKTCNVCKNVQNLEYKKLNNKLKIDDKLLFLKNKTFHIATSNNFNGIILKTNIDCFNFYINILYEEN